MGLFSATFVVLAFDSYLFSLVSGGDTDRVCTRVWSEAIAASGMLGAGGVGLIGSIAWLLANHEGHAVGHVDQVEEGVGVAVALDRLSRAMLFGVSVAVMLLLAATSSDYLDIVFDRNKPAWLTWMMLCSPVVVGAIAWMLLRRQARNRRRVVPVVDFEYEQTQMLSRVSFGMLIYAVVGPVYAGVLTSLPDSVWVVPAIPIAVVTLLVGLVAPAILLVTVILSAPPVVGVHQLARGSTLADPDDELSAADKV
ncbi:hypothetical protein [Amycolatopsis sp. lyj-23]|uniref:hypothetical protein n=1 Tax=Amycolatopsis sp. lyj-23 TaxID=2789283 RepID=UPI00397911F9